MRYHSTKSNHSQYGRSVDSFFSVGIALDELAEMGYAADMSGGLAIAASGLVLGTIVLIAVVLHFGREVLPSSDPSMGEANPQDEVEELRDSSRIKAHLSPWTRWALTSVNLAYGFMAASQGLLLLPLESERLFPGSSSLALGLFAAATGLAQMAGPVAGFWSDSYRSYLGRRRPCVVILALLAWILTYGLSVCSQLRLGSVYAAVYCLQQVVWCALFTVQMGIVPDMVSDDQVASTGGAASANILLGAVGALSVAHMLSDMAMHAQYVFIAGLAAATAILFFLSADEESSALDPGSSFLSEGLLQRIKNYYSFNFRGHPEFTKLLVSKTLYNASIIVKAFLMFFLQDVFEMGGQAQERRLASLIAFAAVVCAAPAALAGSMFLSGASGDKRTDGNEQVSDAGGVWRARILAIAGSSWMAVNWGGPILVAMSITPGEAVQPFMSKMIVGAGVWGLGQGCFLAGDQALSYLLVPSKKESSRLLGFSAICSMIGGVFGGVTCGILLRLLGQADPATPGRPNTPGYTIRGYDSIFVFAMTFNLLIAMVISSIQISLPAKSRSNASSASSSE